MSLERKEQQPVPEDNLIEVDPEELLQDNPAGLIVNPVTYSNLQKAFDPKLFDWPQAVRVSTYSPQQEEIIKWRVVDGLNRNKYCVDYKEEIHQKHPSWRFKIRDVTDAYLRHPDVVRQEDLQKIQQNQKGHTALTTLQYLRAVIPWTKAHEAIAPDRIAALLINGWNNMVGNEMAGKFTALAALSFLANPDVPQATDDMLSKHLGKHNRILIEEKSLDERKLLEGKLREIASIIRESELFPVQVAKAAYRLVSESSPIIGGNERTQEQVYGLIHLPAVENKLADAFRDSAPREQQREQLRIFIIETMQRLSVLYKRDPEQIMPTIEEPLRDPVINFARIVEIFQSTNPRERYKEIQYGINYDRIRQAYFTAQKSAELSEIAKAFIERSSTTTYLHEGEIYKIISAIRSAEHVFIEIDRCADEYSKRQNELSQAGVNPEILASELAKIAKTRADLISLQAPSPQQIINRVTAIREQISLLDRTVNMQIAKFKVGEVVDKVFSEQLQTVHGPLLRNALISYTFSSIIAQPAGEIQISGLITPKIKTVFREIQELDPDLFSDVLFQGRKLRNALEIQRQRKEQAATTPTSLPALPEQKETVEPIRPELYITVQDQIPGKEVKPAAEIDVEQMMAERKEIEEKRRKIMNERFIQRAISFLGGLTDIDLDPEEYERQSRELGLSIIRKLATDIERIADPIKDLRELQVENGRLQNVNHRLREQLINKQQEEAQKDTRTGR